MDESAQQIKWSCCRLAECKGSAEAWALAPCSGICWPVVNSQARVKTADGPTCPCQLMATHASTPKCLSLSWNHQMLVTPTPKVSSGDRLLLQIRPHQKHKSRPPGSMSMTLRCTFAQLTRKVQADATLKPNKATKPTSIPLQKNHLPTGNLSKFEILL